MSERLHNSNENGDINTYILDRRYNNHFNLSREVTGIKALNGRKMS